MVYSILMLNKKGYIMNKFLEYTTTFFAVIGIISLILAVGAIDGGYNGVPMNDNWFAFGICTMIGLMSLVISLLSQSKIERI